LAKKTSRSSKKSWSCGGIGGLCVCENVERQNRVFFHIPHFCDHC